MLELILVVVVLLLIFGGSKLREAGSDLGAVVKSTRRTLRRAVAGPTANAAPSGSRQNAAAQAVPGAAQALDATPDAEFPEVLAARHQQPSRGGSPRG